jgi:predicted CXXCH cytochrome family protein
MKLPFVHTPVKAGACADCHDPHASTHGKLLAASEREICSECHDEIVPRNPASVHAMVAEGDCVACHDPHASANEANLIRPAAELCIGCHAEVGEALSKAAFKHAPAAKSCLGCHTPHASGTAASLLREDVPGLCLGCHDAGAPSFSQRHMGYPVARSDCTSCHDPHASNSAALLWADVHEPVANRTCKQCHQDATSPHPLDTRAAGSELCLAKNRVHWPVIDHQACANCHVPHASAVDALLREPVKPLCAGCHPDAIARQDASLTKHPPIDEGECTLCHSPHASDVVFLLQAENEIELCGGCHDWQKHSSHPIGESVVDPRNANLSVDCGSCHRTHGSSFKHFAHDDPSAALCVGCHEQFRR